MTAAERDSAGGALIPIIAAKHIPRKRMVGARGFEPPTPWSRTKFQPPLKPVKFCCPQWTALESFACRVLKCLVLCSCGVPPQPQLDLHSDSLWRLLEIARRPRTLRLGVNRR